jgi:hypothetical protein
VRKRRSAQRPSSVDNCFRDQAVTNAWQLGNLLSGAEAAVVSRAVKESV